MPILLSLLVFLVCQPLAHAGSILVPGHSDILLGVVPVGASNSYGGVAEDGNGNVYCTGGLTGDIYRLPPGGTLSQWASLPGGQYALALAVDGTTLYAGKAAGELYTLDLTQPAPVPQLSRNLGRAVQDIEFGCGGLDMIIATDNGVVAIDRVLGTMSTLLSGPNVGGIACHPSRNTILATDYNNDMILEVTPGGMQSVFVPMTSNEPDGLDVHPSTGDIYIACSGNGGVMQVVDPAGAMLQTFGTGMQFDPGTWPSPFAFSNDATRVYYGARASSYELRAVDGFPGLVRCDLGTPLPGSTVTGDVTLTFDADDPQMDPVTATFEYSTDAGVSWHSCTPGAMSQHGNPSGLIVTPATGQGFVWDSLVDGVGRAMVAGATVRIQVSDGMNTGFCQVLVDVDNVAPSPTCLLTTSPITQRDDVSLALDLGSVNAPTVDVLVEWSSDGGATWNTASAAAGSSLANPATGVPTGSATLLWDSRGDGLALAVQQTVDLQVTVFDGVAVAPGTCGGAVTLDNTSLCGGICGDCDLGGTGPTVLDALTAAQIAAGLVVPTLGQMGCCDINASMNIDVIDALGIAQAAAGLMPILTCP